MDYTLIHENKLKVALSARDMEDYGLEYHAIDYNDPVTREALVSILDRSRARVRFNPRGAKLYIEVYPCEGGGCVMYFTCLHTAGDGTPRVMPVIFEFDGPDELSDGALHVHQKYAQRIFRSLLYRLERKYRLVIYPLDYSDRLSVYCLSEFGRLVGEGEMPAAYTAEHGDELIGEDAVSVLAEHFYRSR